MRSTSSTTAPKHRDKRPFQPSITSFFAREDTEDYKERGAGPITRSLTRERERQRDSAAPALPAPVQASLLNVGMRVRKSVPEGYKTHKPMNLPSIQTTISNGPISTGNNRSGDVYSVKPPREQVPDAYQHPRELLPFCGLNKIGGYAEQPVTNVHLYGGTDENGDRPMNLFPLPAQAFNTPFSSQDSTNSSLSTDSAPSRNPNPMNPHKRSWEDEDGKPPSLNSNFLFAYPMQVSEDEAPVSPLSATPTQSINSLPQAALRPFAQPKTRRQGGRMIEVDGNLLKEQGMDVDLENADEADGRVRGSSSDFGEAEFLRPWGGREVEMGGV
ncbi:hypothetical protein K469DRAFT_617319 [Zopfia rhizophila CBS 207.26]|uniref:Uncharacterized protein n=1 Tax=Zopfia rhizophila CBS 207.26 TaxID=1314779 RepID=A0A6A6EUM7_9PEZI|nr:hypothetical protein K469DRAFT_617319 [Zopfia rhizophila CBS 207.26]